jgi:hypothetical protein
MEPTLQHSNTPLLQYSWPGDLAGVVGANRIPRSRSFTIPNSVAVGRFAADMFGKNRDVDSNGPADFAGLRTASRFGCGTGGPLKFRD